MLSFVNYRKIGSVKLPKIFRQPKNPYKINCDYKADCFGVNNMSLAFMEEAEFKSAWATSEGVAKRSFGGVPDIRWRTHVAIWAAQNALRIEGDFVDCGVHSGILSRSICEFLNFGAITDRKYWLFDTWAGTPLTGLTDGEKEMAGRYNSTIYKNDIYSLVEKEFSKFPNVHLVRGILPDTFSQAKIDKVAYLSVDLNNAVGEKSCIEYLWPKISKGGIVVIDDYAWNGHGAQKEMWDVFAASQDRIVLTLPTAQGLLMK